MEFYMERPRKPWNDWRMWSMLVPIMVSAVGFFVTGVFAFAFSDIEVIPAPVQSVLVIVGSALIIFGAELNTPFAAIEVFRKIFTKEANTWDFSALVVSLVGTVINLLVTFASRLTIDPAWRLFILNWGPLLSGFAVACDYYGALVELGFFFGSYEMRMATYIEERRLFTARKAQTAQAEPTAEHEAPATKGTDQNLGNPASWPAGTLELLTETILPGMNGEAATLTRQGLADAYAKHGHKLPSPSTVKRHLKVAHTWHQEAGTDEA